MDRLDEFFSKKMNERQLPFDEAHWQQAQQMLDQRDRRRRGIIWWWGTGIFLLLLGGLLFWWNRPADQPAGPESAMAIESEITDDSTAPDAPGTVPDPEASVWPSTGTGTLPSKAQEPSDTLNNVKDQPSDTGQGIRVRDSGIQSKTDVVERGVGSNDNKEKSDGKDDKTEDGLTPDLAPAIAGGAPKKNPGETAPPVAAIDTGEEQKPEGVELLPLIEPDALQKSSALPEMEVIATTRPIVPQKRSFWEITLAATVNPGEGKAFPGGAALLQYNTALNQQYNLYAKAGYRFLNGTFAATQESNVQAYRFGLSVERYQLIPSRLHYLTTGLGIAKSWKRHRLQAGLAYQYLLGVQGTLSRSEKPEFASIFTKPGEASSGWMDKAGFRQHLLGGEVGYQLQILGPFSVQLELQYWLNGLLEEAYESPSDEILQERGPLFIDLGISYRL